MCRLWPCRGGMRVVAGAALGVLGVGCATQSDLNDQARKLQAMIAEQSRSIEGLRRDIDRLRTDLDEGRNKAGQRPAPRMSDKDRLNALDKRLQKQPPPGSEQLGETLSPEGMSTE